MVLFSRWTLLCGVYRPYGLVFYHQLWNRIPLVYHFHVCCCDLFGFACILQFVSSWLQTECQRAYLVWIFRHWPPSHAIQPWSPLLCLEPCRHQDGEQHLSHGACGFLTCMRGGCLLFKHPHLRIIDGDNQVAGDGWLLAGLGFETSATQLT